MNNKEIYIIFFVIVVLIFSLSANTFINVGDSGEFILTSKYLGNSHPSGYPLYNIITKLFTLLPGNNFAVKLSIASIIFIGITGVFWFLIFESVLENIYFAFAGGLCGILGNTVFYMGSSQEIYALFIMFFSIGVYFYIRFIDSENIKYLKLCFFSLGLMSSVHVTGVLYCFFFFIISFFLTDKKKVFKTIPYFLIPVILYLYMFIRNNAFFSWGEIDSIKNFIEFVSGKERGVSSRFFGMSFQQYFKQITIFLKLFMKEYYFLWMSIVPGLYFIYKYERKYFYVFAGPFLINFIFFTSVARDLSDKGHFFLISFISLFFFIWSGIFWIHKNFTNKRPLYLILIPFILYAMNKPDFKDLNLLENYSENIIKTMDDKKQNIIFTTGDELTFYLWVEKYIYNRLENSEVINMDMLNAKWYRKKYGDMETIIRKNMDKNIYFDSYPEFGSTGRFYIRPNGLLYKLEKKYKKIDLSCFEHYILSDLKKNYEKKELEGLRKRYASSYNNNGLALYKENQKEQAITFLRESLKIESNMNVYNNLQKVLSGKPYYEDEIEELIDKNKLQEAEKKLMELKDINRIAQFYWNTGNYASLERLNKIPDYYKGLLFFVKGKYKEAVSLLKNRGDEEALYYLGLCYFKLNEKEKAENVLKVCFEKYNSKRAFMFYKKIKGNTF